MATTHQLSFSEVESVLRLDTATGHLYWRTKPSPQVQPGQRAGRLAKDGYITIKLRGREIAAHRIVWLLAHGRWPAKFIDHIDGNRANNTPVNLRDVDRRTNNENQRRAHRTNQTGLLGVSLHGPTGQFVAQISVAGMVRHIGLYARAAEAHEAYLQAKRQLHAGATI